MQNPVTFWHIEHMHFARLLDFLETQMAAFAAGNHADYELMRDVVHYLRHFADRYHHPHEDETFARLFNRAPDLQPVLKRLMEEHRSLAQAGEDFLSTLEAILQDNLLERAAVETSAAAYICNYRRHIDAEEKDVLPRAALLFRPEDWAAIAEKVQTGPDPLFGKAVESRYQRLHEQIRRYWLAENQYLAF